MTALALSPISFGFLIAVGISKLLFNLSSTYFINSTKTLALIGWLNIGLSLIVVLSIVFARPAKN